MQDFRNLEVWRLAHGLTLEIYKVTRAFPSDERFGLTSQVRRAAVSVEANLAEGCGRGSDADFARFVQIALGSASEIECELLIAKDLGFLNPQAHDEIAARVQSIKRMLNALLTRLRSSQ